VQTFDQAAPAVATEAPGDRTDPKLRPLRPAELPFTESERETVTILFAGLTWKHESLIEGLLRGAGYRCQRLPETDRAAHEVGKGFCASGLCNPVYFTAGNLIRFLQEKERAGITRKEIVKRYLYFTAACGGPCRFGMYESEFRQALNAAGYDGFRILSFSQDRGIHASTGHTGLQFSVDFGMNAMHAFILGDLLNSTQHRLRPFEVQPGAVDKSIAEMADRIAEHFRSDDGYELANCVPKFLRLNRNSRYYRYPNTIGKVWSHLYGDTLSTVLPAASNELKHVEVDWLRVRPVVKVIGEFWAQMTESDGNFRMLEFLEKEGAEVSIEPISMWLLYLLHQKKSQVAYRQKMATYTAPWTSPGRAITSRAASLGKRLGFTIAAKIYLHHFHRLAKMLGLPDQVLAPQQTLSELAEPHYNTFLRGGEGHLEVAKTLYYSRQRISHLVLALKPFGCLPSVQSDAVQASLTERFPEVNFLPVETSADGEIHAYSRVQMALSEARTRASLEFERALKSARHSLEDIRCFVGEHAVLRHALYPIPRHPGIVSTAANFLLHTDQLMSARSAQNAGAHPKRVRTGNPSAVGQIHSNQELES